MAANRPSTAFVVTLIDVLTKYAFHAGELTSLAVDRSVHMLASSASQEVVRLVSVREDEGTRYHVCLNLPPQS